MTAAKTPESKPAPAPRHDHDARLQAMCVMHPTAAKQLMALHDEATAQGFDWSKILADLPQLVAIVAGWFKAK